MSNEAVTQEQFQELKESFQELKQSLEESMNKLRTWTVSAFFGSIVVVGTLIGAYAMFLLRL